MATKNLEIIIGNLQWWTIVGMALVSTALILIFLSYATLQIIPVIPFPSISFSFLALSEQVFTIGIIGLCIGLVIILYSKFRLSKLGLDRQT